MSPLALMDTIRSLLSSFLRSWWAVIGRSTLTPRTIIGVITMKMISSTSTTSTSGVTLISARTCPLGWRFRWPPARGPRGQVVITRSRVPAQDRVDQLGRGLVDVDGDVVEARGEVVVEPDRDDRDAEADGGGHQRLGDAGRHGADAAAALGRIGQLLERGDDAADGAEQADERRRRRDRRQHRHAAAQAGELALLAALHGAVDDLGHLERGPGRRRRGRARARIRSARCR